MASVPGYEMLEIKHKFLNAVAIQLDSSIGWLSNLVKNPLKLMIL